jgi:hypothetical protein
MAKRQKLLLTVDAIVNLILGILLLFVPVGLARWLGLPQTRPFFYASVLGAVLVGIGLALMLEAYGASLGVRGLGLHGAIAINLCGGSAVLLQVMTVPLTMPARGRVILWTVGSVVVLIGLGEVAFWTFASILKARREQDETWRSVTV